MLGCEIIMHKNCIHGSSHEQISKITQVNVATMVCFHFQYTKHGNVSKASVTRLEWFVQNFGNPSILWEKI